MPTLKQEILGSVDPKDYYDWYLDEQIDWPGDGSDARVSSPNRADKNPSMYLNPSNGTWFDHGGQSEDSDTGFGGQSIISFHSTFEDKGSKEASVEIYHEFIRPIIDSRRIRKTHRSLLSQPQAMQYLKNTRLLTRETIDKYKLGWDGDRINFPIPNEHKLYVNIKKYDPLAKSRGVPKMLNHKDKGEPRRFGSPAMIYPFDAVSVAHQEGYIVVVEGEWDALFLNQLRIPAITSTAGAKTWPKQYTELMRNLEVILCLDNDPTGTLAAKKLVKKLSKVAREIKNIRVPRKYGKDVLDWATHSKVMKKRMGWLAVIGRAPTVIKNTEEYVTKNNSITEVRLDKARAHSNIGKIMSIKAIVAGKATNPLSVPLKYRITCDNPGADEDCPLANSREDHMDGEIDPQSEFMFDLLQKRKTQVLATLMKRHGFDPRSDAKPKLDVLEYASFEEVRIQPAFDSGGGEHVTAEAYTMGLGLRANQTYHFTGTSFPAEVCNITKLIFTENKPAQSQADTFVMTPPILDELKVFQAKGETKRAVVKKLYDMAEWQGRNITKIRERPDLHIACDLVFHSVNEFDFNGEYVHRGMLDVMVIGDTRCGKGFVAEGLQRYYQVGEVASGENCTFAGLVGGVQQMGKQWFVTWGVIPMNHNRMVVIDEAGAIPEQGGFGRLSRVRSEGIAEMTKIVRESAAAKTRLLWLANPTSGRPIMSYPSGAHAIKELVGSNEDISRFDYALTVATDEVDTQIINELRDDHEISDEGKYSRKSSQLLVMWAWSRSKDQIKFSKASTKFIIESAIELGKKYSSTIPLVQAENIRIKLAKISTAVAARVFSCDRTGEDIVVMKQHVQAAKMLINQFYSKPSMAYDRYSMKDRNDQEMGAEDLVRKIFDDIRGGAGKPLIDFLAGHIIFTVDAMADVLPIEEDPKEIVRKLVQAKCINRSGTKNWYRHSVEFREWLATNQKESR